MPPISIEQQWHIWAYKDVQPIMYTVTYKSSGNSQDLCVSDIDECDDSLRCPGKECVNTQGSYNCVSCKPGFGLLNGQCSGVLNQHVLFI